MKPIAVAATLWALAASATAADRDTEIYKAYDGPEVPAAQLVVLKIAQNYPGFHVFEKPEVGVLGYDGPPAGWPVPPGCRERLENRSKCALLGS